MRVLIREVAYRDLDEIHAWITIDNPVAADRVVDRIIKSIELLGHFPYIGRAGKAAGTREWVVSSLPYIIVYTSREWITRPRN
jgi:toxin ParE1/3/4